MFEVGGADLLKVKALRWVKGWIWFYRLLLAAAEYKRKQGDTF
ncbi:hypothetical protein [uncultured Amphritea sp.]|nr:hypothetical protein [uncultured Amphritea sp.]